METVRSGNPFFQKSNRGGNFQAGEYSKGGMIHGDCLASHDSNDMRRGLKKYEMTKLTQTQRSQRNTPKEKLIGRFGKNTYRFTIIKHRIIKHRILHKFGPSYEHASSKDYDLIIRKHIGAKLDMGAKSCSRWTWSIEDAQSEKFSQAHMYSAMSR